jgi:NAD(P)-dependent dehydrogenase (short-subunit alcohol dehydrogenase family)
MTSLSGKVALVTGAASGIGEATVERLAAEGARVIAADIDVAGGEAIASKAGGEFMQLDVTDAARWEAVVGQIQSSHGGIDLAYLNAGITTYPASDKGLAEYTIDGLDLENYRRIMRVNIDGVVLGARAVTPAIEARGGGAIVATASVAGLIGFAPDPIYTLTKHAVIGFVRALAPALAPRGIRVHAICPAGVATNILGQGIMERARTSGFDLMEPSQIADAVVQAWKSEKTGRLLVCRHGKDHMHYRFTSIEDLGID